MVAPSEKRAVSIAISSSSSTKIVLGVLARKRRLTRADRNNQGERHDRSNKSGVAFAGEAGRMTRTIARSGEHVAAEERRGDRSHRGRADQSLRPRALARYTRTISLLEALDPDVIAAYSRRATGEKFLINPSLAIE